MKTRKQILLNIEYLHYQAFLVDYEIFTSSILIRDIKNIQDFAIIVGRIEAYLDVLFPNNIETANIVNNYLKLKAFKSLEKYNPRLDLEALKDRHKLENIQISLKS